MATSKAYDLSNLWDGISNGAKWDAGVVFNRTNALPLDKFSVFDSLSAAQDYAMNNAVAYPGQIITVVDGQQHKVTAYQIETDGEISAITPPLDVDDLPLSGGTGIDITEEGFININLSTGLDVDANNNLIVGFSAIDGGSASA